METRPWKQHALWAPWQSGNMNRISFGELAVPSKFAAILLFSFKNFLGCEFKLFEAPSIFFTIIRHNVIDMAKLWLASRMRLFWTVISTCGKSISQSLLYEWIKCRYILRGKHKGNTYVIKSVAVGALEFLKIITCVYDAQQMWPFLQYNP
jgi:hypothetical protein